MTAVSKAPKVMAEALSARIAKKTWAKLSPEAKRHMMKVNAEIIRKDLTRQAVRDPKNIVIAGAVGVGIAAGLYALLRNNKK